MEKEGTKKIRKGDQVLVCAGNSKGMKGEVVLRQGDRVLVRGLNIARKHVKKSKQHPQGGIVEVERPIHISNVCACDSDGKKLKLKIETMGETGKSLCYEKEGQKVVWRSIKQRKM